MSTPRFHALLPGGRLSGDWYPGEIPKNIEIGPNCVVDSTFCFKEFRSTARVGLRIGSNVTLWRTSLAADESGTIEIGSDCYLANASLVAARRIIIGSRVFIAGGVTIIDSDFHPLDPAARLADTIALSPVGDRKRRPSVSASEVVIEDDVWIGYNATILKGVRIGSGTVVSPGAVVVEDVPPDEVIAGNPASLVK